MKPFLQKISTKSPLLIPQNHTKTHKIHVYCITRHQQKEQTRRMSKALQSFHEVQSVFFRNTNRLTIKQVSDKFSKFGLIESIHQTGTPAGLCFVKFTTEKSAQRCALAMRNDSTITLRAFDPNSPNRAYKLQSAGHMAKRRIQEKLSSVMKKGEELCDKTNGVDGIVSSVIGSSNVLAYSHVLSKKKEAEPKNNHSGTTFESLEDILESSVEYLETLQPMSREESIVNLSEVSKDIPEIVKKVRMISGGNEIEKSFYVLMRSQVEWEDLHGVDVEYVPAVAIVIGNIPMGCGVEFLLNLFEDYHPLVSSKIKSITEGSFRYCYVYFENSCDCREVEQRYDNVEVFGMHLVVQSAKVLRKKLDELDVFCI